MKKPVEGFEMFVAPFVILFGEKETQLKGKKGKSFWQTALKLLMKVNFYSLITDYQLETIPPSRINKIQPFFRDPFYNIQKATQLHPSLGNLVSWILGSLKM